MMRYAMQRTAPRRPALTWLVLIPAVLISACYTPATRAQELDFPDSVTTEQMMADQLVGMAWMLFGREAEPRPDQLERARVLLDMAAELNSDDEGMWQLTMGLARGQEDHALLIKSLRNYLRLVPRDDAAQLELIKTKLGSVESLDDYLESLERLLRSKSAMQLSAPLRSRLATLAAQAAQEIGDHDRFAAWLGYAVQIDEANPEAAKMVYDLTMEREGSPRQQGAALVGVLKSNPVDPSVRIALASLLMNEGLYSHAKDQFNLSMGLVDMQTRLGLLNQYAMCLIATGQDDMVPPLLLDLQLFLRQMAYAENPDLAAELDPEEPESLDDLPPLPATLEFVRLVLLQDGNPVAAKASFQQLRDFSAAFQDEQEKQDSYAQLTWVGAVFNQDSAWVKSRIALLDPDDEDARLASGWLALHEGDNEIARATFESLGTDNMFARLGLASMPELNDEQRAEAYQQIVWDAPSSMSAIVAARRLLSMGKIVNATGDGVSIRVLVDNLPRQLWSPALSVSPWLRMKLRVAPGSFGYLQPMRGRASIRNVTRMPLSIGPGGAIQSVLMVVCSPSIRSEPVGQLQPTFFNMGRRLTLAPGQSIEADIRLDRFDLGQLAANYPTATITYSATAILDPRPQPGGGVVAGPLGGSNNVGSLQARGQPATPNNLQLWIKDLDGTDPAIRAIAITRLLIIARQPAETIEAQDFRARISDLISQRYPSFDPVLQAWTVRFMLPDEDGEPVSRRVIDLAQRSDNPMVRIMFLVMNASSPTSSVLTDAIRHDDPTIRAFALAMKEGLEKDAQRAAALEAESDGDHAGHGHGPGGHGDDHAADPFAPTPIDPLGITPSTDDPWLP
jgi:tetratricopeptide (TPR) repeat protein